MVRSGPSIRYFLLTANAFFLLLPIGAVVFLRLWDKHLVRITEERLIAEATVIAVAWQERLTAHGMPTEAGQTRRAPPAQLVEGYEILVSEESPTPAAVGVGPLAKEGREFSSLLAAGPGANGSEARVLDADGCALSSSRDDGGGCFGSRSEVRQALRGEYTAVVRQRSPADTATDAEAVPSGRVRVYIAVPIVAGEVVAGVVYLSRASSSPLEAVWTLRRTIIIALVGCLLIMVTVSLFLSWAISRPVWAITAAAEAVARGEPRRGFQATGLIPSEIHVLGLALERMTAQLRERTRYITEFANNVSHELKTPLSGIRGAVELLHDEWQHMEEPQRQRFLANIEADVDRMLRLVQRLLQLARIEHSADEIETIEVRGFVPNLVERYGDHVVLSFGRPPETVAINGDHLETAMSNLIDNAVRHGEGKPVEVHIDGDDSGRLVVRVRDHGTGISAGNQRRVFERFFTTERDRGGTGLGLAIVKAIAESRGGSVAFETGSEGTTFTLVV